ncbi:hypothetical protein [Streptomyces sp. NPDC005435]|uniref:hypothetical protein n=1 Tax=Streptomyces sp. NPDC005435 TaxID=3154464 RepID=UPI003451940C
MEALEAATGPAGQLLFTHPSEHWINIAASACLLLLRMTGRRCPHAPRTHDQHDQPALKTERAQDSDAREALDAT